MLVCIFLECKEQFGNKIISICQNFFVFVSPALHMLSTDCQCNDIHILFDDVSYVDRSTQIKKKIYSFSENTIKKFISCNDNFQIFTCASHS